MKIKGAKSVHYESGPNMTPLVDVVMVILIFLMLTGSFGAVAHFLPSSMPIKQTGHGKIDPNKIPKVPDQQLEVYVQSRGQDIYVAKLSDGVEYFNGTAKSGKTLVQALTEKRQAHQAGGKTADTLQVLLCPRLSTRMDHLMSVYESAMKAECPKIGFQTANQP
jgi:biopolymer transport protein ExbD